MIANDIAGKACQGTNTLANSVPASAANTKRFVPLTLHVNGIKPFILATDTEAQ